ncbi:hypothetical protein [Hankyongella ginsenosidimutans]|uniref:hypothetical protein n=1 Tax=Hankyongella ginsenosidimutans TaxID=1763828 RepID=UPI001CA31D98|nr:hypothetical protein [Hankyongella ginsenosidimutans]
MLCGLWLRRRLAVARDETALLRMTLEARYAELSDTRAALSAEQARAARLPELETLLEQERLTRSSLEVRLARIETEREEQQRRLEEKIATLTDLREAMTREFQAAAEQSLRGSQQAFFELANQSFAQHQERSGENSTAYAASSRRWSRRCATCSASIKPAFRTWSGCARTPTVACAHRLRR